MKNLFYVGMDHHRTHLTWYKKILGGAFFDFPSNTYDKAFDRVLAADSGDVIWFFPNIYPNLHPFLRGKQVYVGHGMVGFKRWLNDDRIDSLSKHFDQVLSISPLEQRWMVEGGVPSKTIIPVGQPLLLECSRLGWEENTLLVSFVGFGDWGEFDVLLDCLRRPDKRIRYFVTLHPSLPKEKVDKIQIAVSASGNIQRIYTQNELIEAMNICSAIMVSSSSVAGPFWFSGKPVILARGFLGRNPFRGWAEIKKRIADEIFSKVIEESTLVSPFRPFSYRRFKTAKVAKSSRALFYPWNDSEAELTERTRTAYAELVRRHDREACD